MDTCCPAVFINSISFEVPALDFHARLVNHYHHMALGAVVDREKESYEQLARFMKLSGVEHRYSVLGLDNTDESFQKFLRFQGEESSCERRSTGARMIKFSELAAPLAYKTVEKLFDTGDRQRITHLIVASCTGFHSPFLDAAIIRRFDLSKNVKRLTLGFMGCHAAFNALRAAYDTVRAEPKSRVLIVAIELCTLHRQNPFAEMERESFQSKAITNSLFGDACGAAIVSCRQAGLQILDFSSTLFPDPEYVDLLTWKIGDHGFTMGLSKELPEKLYAAIRADPDLQGLSATGIDEWAIHAGGPRIISSVARSLEISPKKLRRSQEVLRQFGNTSSTSILKNLRGILEMPVGKRKICAIGVGPGIQVETASFAVD